MFRYDTFLTSVVYQIFAKLNFTGDKHLSHKVHDGRSFACKSGLWIFWHLTVTRSFTIWTYMPFKQCCSFSHHICLLYASHVPVLLHSTYAGFSNLYFRVTLWTSLHWKWLQELHLSYSGMNVFAFVDLPNILPVYLVTNNIF